MLPPLNRTQKSQLNLDLNVESPEYKNTFIRRQNQKQFQNLNEQISQGDIEAGQYGQEVLTQKLQKLNIPSFSRMAHTTTNTPLLRNKARSIQRYETINSENSLQQEIEELDQTPRQILKQKINVTASRNNGLNLKDLQYQLLSQRGASNSVSDSINTWNASTSKFMGKPLSKANQSASQDRTNFSTRQLNSQIDLTCINEKKIFSTPIQDILDKKRIEKVQSRIQCNDSTNSFAPQTTKKYNLLRPPIYNKYQSSPQQDTNYPSLKQDMIKNLQISQGCAPLSSNDLSQKQYSFQQSNPLTLSTQESMTELSSASVNCKNYMKSQQINKGFFRNSSVNNSTSDILINDKEKQVVKQQQRKLLLAQIKQTAQDKDNLIKKLNDPQFIDKLAQRLQRMESAQLSDSDLQNYTQYSRDNACNSKQASGDLHNLIEMIPTP
eukprot:403354930